MARQTTHLDTHGFETRCGMEIEGWTGGHFDRRLVQLVEVTNDPAQVTCTRRGCRQYPAS